VLIVADELGRRDFGCYSPCKLHKPRIDPRAREVLRFTQFYARAPVCAPSPRDDEEFAHEGPMALRKATRTPAESWTRAVAVELVEHDAESLSRPQ
jgi:hypothetical protein